jgi:hypothetical protein
MRLLNAQRLEDRLLQVFLLLAVLGSILGNIFDIDPGWQIPLVFAALYAILRVVSQLRDQDGQLTFVYYKNNSEFYSSVQRIMQRAEETVSVTYLRLLPPPGFHSPEADSYFQYGLKWARGDSHKEFRRIFGVPPGGAMLEWLRTHHAETRSIPNYSVRVIPWSLGVDGLNVALIDDKTVFLALTGEGQQMRGLSFGTPEAIGYFTEYYNRLWSGAEPLASFVARFPAGAETGAPGATPPPGAGRPAG